MIQSLFSQLFANIMSWIDAKTCEQERRLAFFAKFNMMQLDCNKRLTNDEIIYFQDLIVFLEKNYC